jgi:hypothetical protein
MYSYKNGEVVKFFPSFFLLSGIRNGKYQDQGLGMNNEQISQHRVYVRSGEIESQSSGVLQL